MCYGDFKDLTRRTTSDKILRDKVFNIAKNPKYDGYQGRLASMVYKIFDKKNHVVSLLLHGRKPSLGDLHKINMLLKMKICQAEN